MFYLLHGENELARQEALAEVVAASGLTPDLRAMNTEALSPDSTTNDLRRACNTLPFLGEARIVVAEGLLGKARGQAAQEIADILRDAPATTILIFVEEKSVSAKHPLIAQAKDLGLKVRHFAIPDARDLPAWIRERTAHHGGTIEPRAASLLAQNIGGHLRLLDQEIQKLLLYVGERGAITAQDIAVMVPYIQSADVIFQMVDALGQRDSRRAAVYLHRLLEVGEHPLGIFGMVVRQFRLLIQTRWLMDQHYLQKQAGARLKLHPYVARKIYAQAGKFSLDQLRDAYRTLSESDLAVKRGEIPAETALDLLVAQLSRL